MEQERPAGTGGHKKKKTGKRPPTEEEQSEPKGVELCQRVQLHTMMSQRLSHMNKRCWLLSPAEVKE